MVVDHHSVIPPSTGKALHVAQVAPVVPGRSTGAVALQSTGQSRHSEAGEEAHSEGESLTESAQHLFEAIGKSADTFAEAAMETAKEATKQAVELSTRASHLLVTGSAQLHHAANLQAFSHDSARTALALKLNGQHEIGDMLARTGQVIGQGARAFGNLGAQQVVKGVVLGQRAVEEAARAGEALTKSEKFTSIGKLAEGAEKFLNGFELGQHVGALVKNVHNAQKFSAAADDLVRSEIKDAAAGSAIKLTLAVGELGGPAGTLLGIPLALKMGRFASDKSAELYDKYVSATVKSLVLTAHQRTSAAIVAAGKTAHGLQARAQVLLKMATRTSARHGSAPKVHVRKNVRGTLHTRFHSAPGQRENTGALPALPTQPKRPQPPRGAAPPANAPSGTSVNAPTSTPSSGPTTAEWALYALLLNGDYGPPLEALSGSAGALPNTNTAVGSVFGSLVGATAGGFLSGFFGLGEDAVSEGADLIGVFA